MTPKYGFCFRPEHGRGDCSGFLHLWVAGGRGDTCFVPTGYDVRYEEWSAVSGVITEGATPARLSVLSDYKAATERDLRLVGDIVRTMETDGRGCTASDIVKAYLADRQGGKMPVGEVMTA
jgi:hypothetical protein